jgi:uncharacterized membrane protein YadS
MNWFKKNIYGIIFTFIIAIIATVLGNIYPIIGGAVFGIIIGIIINNIFGKPKSTFSGVNFTSKKYFLCSSCWCLCYHR